MYLQVNPAVVNLTSGHSLTSFYFILALSGQDPRGTGGPAGACLHARVRGVGEEAVCWRTIKYHDDLEGEKIN